MGENFWLAFLLTLIAGLSTGIGSIIAFFFKKRQKSFLSFGLGFSAGVMIYVSFMEILPKASEELTQGLGDGVGEWAALGAFFSGILFTAVIDVFVPKDINPHEVHSEKEAQVLKPGRDIVYDQALAQTGIFTALAIGIHNFPEGMATFASALSDPALGISIAVAVAIHNIPEGISVSLPIYYATGDRKKAFMYSMLSGLAEPAGALLGYLLLRPFLTDTVFGILFGGVAGVMIYISFDEMLPTAREYSKGHIVIAGLAAGMLVMGISLVLL